MAKNGRKQIIQYVNKKGILVTELCHDPATCKKHNKRKRVNTGLSLSQLIAENPMLFVETEPVEQALNIAQFSDDRKELAVYASHRDPLVRANVAKNLSTDSKTIAQLALDEDSLVSSLALRDYRLPKKFFKKYRDASAYIRGLLAENPSAPAGLIEAASHAPEDNIRQAVASNFKASPEVLAVLASDKDWLVRSSVARNVNATVDTLDFLAKDVEPNVRAAVMSNHMASENTITGLSFDKDPKVRNSIYLNSNTSIENAKSIVSMQGGKIAHTVAQILAAKQAN